MKSAFIKEGDSLTLRCSLVLKVLFMTFTEKSKGKHNQQKEHGKRHHSVPPMLTNMRSKGFSVLKYHSSDSLSRKIIPKEKHSWIRTLR